MGGIMTEDMDKERGIKACLEILETARMIDEQDARWEKVVYEIMKKCDIEYYPEKKHFLETGNSKTYNEIDNYASVKYMVAYTGLDTHLEYKMKQAIFNTMLFCEINYMPYLRLQFVKANELSGYETILRNSSLEEQRIKLNLLSKKSYEKLHKGGKL